MARANKPPFQQQQRLRIPKEMKAQSAAAEQQRRELEQDPKKKKQLERFESLTLTEKIFVRVRPEKAYFLALPQDQRAKWDATVARSQFVAPGKKMPVPTKAAQGVGFELVYKATTVGMFRYRYEFVQQPTGFMLQATQGGSILFAGVAESWAFQGARGGTEITLTRTYVPRFKWLRNRAVQYQEKFLKATLEGLKRYIEENAQ
jgi:Polyketide cyclase / dehydrase and lipid transport